MKIAEDLKLLPPPEKKATCIVLNRLGFSYRQIRDIVNVPTTTAFTWSKGEIPPDLEQFRTNLEENFKDYEVILAAKAAARINSTIARAKIKDALEVYRSMTNKDLKQPTVAIQQNISLEEQRKEVEDGDTTEVLAGRFVKLAEEIEALQEDGSGTEVGQIGESGSDPGDQ